MTEEPSYDELCEENLTLLGEREALELRVRVLEQRLSNAERISSNENLSMEMERLQAELERRSNEVRTAHSDVRAAVNVANEAKAEISRLEHVLAEKDERLQDTMKDVAEQAHWERSSDSPGRLARREAALELKFADALDNAEKSKAEAVILKSQVYTLEAALSAAAAEKDEVQMLRSRDVATLDVAEIQREETCVLLEESNDNARRLRVERDPGTAGC